MERHIAEGNSLFVDELFEQALVHYQAAVSDYHATADAFVKLSATFLKLSRYAESAQAAERAVKLDATVPAAHRTLGAALFHEGKFHAAKRHLLRSVTLLRSGGGGDAATLIAAVEAQAAEAQVQIDAGKAAPEGAEAALAQMEVEPPRPSTGGAKSVAQLESALGHLAADGGPTASAAAPSSSSSAAAAAASTVAADADARVPPKINHQWYQSATQVTVTLLVRDVDKSASSFHVTGKWLTAELQVRGKTDFLGFCISLCGDVVPGEVAVTVRPANVELKVTKADHAQFMWPQLETAPVTAAASHHHGVVPTGGSSGGSAAAVPSPYASKRDWRALEKGISEESKAIDADPNDGLQNLFRTIYKDADEETRRAMNKSYQMSGGTVLSTNWKEVKDKEFAVKTRNQFTGKWDDDKREDRPKEGDDDALDEGK